MSSGDDVGDGCDIGGDCEESPRGRVSGGALSVHCSCTCGERQVLSESSSSSCSG